MENIKRLIKENNLLTPGDVIGVGVSGGSDSMALLHYLNSIAEELDIEVVAIHVNHCIRDNSSDDADFVMKYCKENHIRAYKFRVDVPKIAEEKNLSLEVAAREARFGVFDAVIKNGVVSKIAIAHHKKDQAETILMNLFRGTGIAGTRGMELLRDGVYIRPMLATSKESILTYVNRYDIPYVEDQTNKDNSFSRNFIRNQIIPLIETKWPGVVEKIITFGKSCRDDEQFISSQVLSDAFIVSERTVRIPNTYFLYPNAIVSRMIFKALDIIKVQKDIERKHVEMIKELALNGKNGNSLDLPCGVTAIKEYDFLTITNLEKKVITLEEPFKPGSFEVENFGMVSVKRTKFTTADKGELLVDAKKIPKNAVWRFKESGDMFEKFGGGTKKLKDYLIDRKVPLRIRSYLPVLAIGNEILAIAGVEIAESVKIDNDTTQILKIVIS